MLWNVVYIFVFLLVTHEFILINEEFFVVLSFILCFSFLFSVLSDTLASYQKEKVDETTKIFLELFNRRLSLLRTQKENLLTYKKFSLLNKQLLSYVLSKLENKTREINAKIPLVFDFHFRYLLDQLVLSYISYVEKIIRTFVKTAHSYFYTKLSKPIFFVRPKGRLVASYIDIFKYGLSADDSRRSIFWKEVHPSRSFLALPSHKTGVWPVLIKSKKVRIWFALFLRNPILFF